MAASIFYKMQYWQALTSLKIFLECTLPLTLPGWFPFLLRKTPRINCLLVIHSSNPLKTYDIIRAITLIGHLEISASAYLHQHWHWHRHWHCKNFTFAIRNFLWKIGHLYQTPLEITSLKTPTGSERNFFAKQRTFTLKYLIFITLSNSLVN